MVRVLFLKPDFYVNADLEEREAGLVTSWFSAYGPIRMIHEHF